MNAAPALRASGPEEPGPRAAWRLRVLAAAGMASREIAPRIFGIAVLAGLWELISLRLGFLLPSPYATVRDIVDNFTSSPYLANIGISSGGYLGQLLFTVRNVVVGVAVGTVLGGAAGLAGVAFPLLSQFVNPLVAFFGSAPIFVAAPFFLIWFGVVSFGPLIFVMFYTALLVYIFAGRACSNIRPEYIESARCLGADAGVIFRRIYMPASVPELLGGLRIALAGAWGLEAIGELMGVDRGIGYLIKFYSDALNVQAMVALVVLLGATAIIFDFVLVRITHIFIRWTTAGRRLNL